jgi:hypothetical protein
VDLKLRQKLVAVFAFASVVASSGGAFAVPSYSIANAPSDVHPGDVFTVDVILNLDGNSSTGHEVSVDFIPGILVANAAAEWGVPPYAVNISSGVRGIDNAAGVVDQFEAAAFTAITPAAPTAMPTPRPTPDNECQCVPHRVVPSLNLAALNKTESNGNRPSKTRFRGSRSKKAKSLGNRSKQTREVGVILKAKERTLGACRPMSSTDTFSLRLQMVDDDGDLILDETRTGLKCDRRVDQEKFMVSYEVENCAGSEAPRRKSNGEVTVTATTEDGELIASRVLKCKK